MSRPNLHSYVAHPYRILLVAEAANPDWASVPVDRGALAHVVDVHLVTYVRNRHAIIYAELIEGCDRLAIDNERIAAPFHKLAKWRSN